MPPQRLRSKPPCDKDPSNQSTLALLNQVSGMLGEGNNSAIKEPIEPVAIPSELAALPPASDARTISAAVRGLLSRPADARLLFSPGWNSKPRRGRW